MPKSIIFYIANASQLGFRFLQMILITRFLSGVDLGAYYATAAYPQLLSRVFDLGLPHAVRYFVLQVPAATGFIIRSVMLFAALIFLPIFCIFYFLDTLPLESEEIVQLIAASYFLLSVYCVVLIVNSILNAIILSFEQFISSLLSSTLPYVVSITILVMLHYSADGLQAHDVLVLLLITEGSIFAIHISFILKKIHFASWHHPEAHISIREIFAYAFQIYPSGILKVIVTRLDRVVLSFLASPVFIGYYSVLMTIRDTSIFPVISYSQIFMNKLSGILKTTQLAVRRLLYKNLIAVAGLYLAGFLLFLLLQDIALRFFFKEQQVSSELYTASYFLSLSTIPLALTSLIHTYFFTSNNPRYISISSLFTIITFYGFVLLSYGKTGSNSFLYASVFSAATGFIYLFIKLNILLKRP